MTIIAIGAVLPASPDFARRSDVAASGFTVPAALARAASARAGGASAVTDAGAMLALQEEVGRDADRPGESADREARRHGQDILEALTALQKDLLTGGSGQGLSRLAALADIMPAAHDPALAHVLSSIRLRARLEILRMASRSPGGTPSPGPADTPASVTDP